MEGDVDAEPTIVKIVDDSQAGASVVVDLPFKIFLDAEAKWEYVRGELVRIFDRLEHDLGQLRGDLGEAMRQAQACALEGDARTIIREGLSGRGPICWPLAHMAKPRRPTLCSAASQRTFSQMRHSMSWR